jgi:hypothetical protein
MLIGMLMTVAIICLLVAGPTIENTLVAIAVYGGMILGTILVFWYSQRVSGGIADFFMGGSGSQKVNETFGLADRYEAQHKYEDAIEVYLRAINKDKKNPLPRKKLADLYYKLGDYDNSITYMQETLDIPKAMSQDERCTLMNRIADLYLQHKHDKRSAVAILKRLVKELPDSKYAVYARERIVQIKSSN